MEVLAPFHQIIRSASHSGHRSERHFTTPRNVIFTLLLLTLLPWLRLKGEKLFATSNISKKSTSKELMLQESVSIAMNKDPRSHLGEVISMISTQLNANYAGAKQLCAVFFL